MHRVHTRTTQRYMGNKETKVVHDLSRERPECDIRAILVQRAGVGFIPDNVARAEEEGFTRCERCF